MKRMLCILLSMLMVLSLCACGGSASPVAEPAPAEAEAAEPATEAVPEEAATPEPITLPPYEPFETPFGFKYEYPEEYQHLKGELIWRCSSFGYGELHAALYYVAVPDAEREAFREKTALSAKNIDGWNPEWTRDYKYIPIFNVVALKDNDETVEYYETVSLADYIEQNYEKPEDSANKSTYVSVYLDTVSLDNGWKLVVQREALCSFEGEEYPLSAYVGWLEEGYREEALALMEKPEVFISGLKEAPWELPGQVGSKVSFVSRTLQGDTVTSEELFAGHKVTMVNIWATWCPPCIAELPELEKLNASFAEQGCQIIGICTDATYEAAKEEAFRILDDAGVTYPNILSNLDMVWANIDTYPTTFFIGEDGTILTEPVVGASPSAYTRVLNQALAQVG